MKLQPLLDLGQDVLRRSVAAPPVNFSFAEQPERAAHGQRR